jgi:cytochrome bd ubiquinol oxidase subunit I
LPAAQVLTSLSLFAVLYSSLFVTTLFFASKIIRKGPNLTLLAPFTTAATEHKLDSRPLNQ